jgi:hypothetical protein
MEILMLTYNDWANTGWRFAKCLKLLGLDVQFYKGRKHKFGYPDQAPIHDAIYIKRKQCEHPVIIDVPELKPLIEQARIVHFTASTFLRTGADLGGKYVVVQHGGSTYRKAPSKVNSFFNPLVNSTILQCPDLLNLGAKNEVLIYYPVDIDLLQPKFDRKNKDKLLIGHFPSTPATKGTPTIVNVINKLKKNKAINNKFTYVGSTVGAPWQKHLERVANCDILIETLNPRFDGRSFGEWGNQAIEAAALGKIVITNSLTTDLYKKEYGDCALNIANTAAELEKHLRNIFEMNDSDILKKKKQTRKWVVEKHSMAATAVRLWEKVYCNFFHGERKKEIENRIEELKRSFDKCQMCLC